MLAKIQAQQEPVAPDEDWVQGPYISETMGRGWCVRIDGTDIFQGLNKYGCKGRISFQIAGDLKSKEEAESVLRKWLLDAAPQPLEPANVPDLTDAYAGAREDIAIWKKRALEGEALNRKFQAELNGPTFMGEPSAQQAVSQDAQRFSRLKKEADECGVTIRDTEFVCGEGLSDFVDVLIKEDRNA